MEYPLRPDLERMDKVAMDIWTKRAIANTEHFFYKENFVYKIPTHEHAYWYEMTTESLYIEAFCVEYGYNVPPCAENIPDQFKNPAEVGRFVVGIVGEMTNFSCYREIPKEFIIQEAVWRLIIDGVSGKAKNLAINGVYHAGNSKWIEIFIKDGVELLKVTGEGLNFIDVKGRTGQSTKAPLLGISMKDAANVLSDGDEKSSRLAVVRWQKSRNSKPNCIGIDPYHKQVKLYEPSQLIKYIREMEGDVSQEIVEKILRLNCREPRMPEPPTK